jgi:CubicO group peptidase (beta-lactamase class C family)
VKRLAVALLAGSSLSASCERAAPSEEPPPAPPRSAAALATPPAVTAPPPPPEPVGPRPVDPARLEALLAEARENASDALLVIQDGKPLAEWSSPRAATPIQTMSITKSVLALVAGCTKLELDQKVSALFPSFKGDATVRHLLTHSSGIDEGKGTAAIYASKSFVGQALASQITSEPGTSYAYGNRATNLLSGVIARAAGKPADEVARECLFEPLGIRSYRWSRDRAGDAHGLAGLHLLPQGLARIGELVLGEGELGGKRILPRDWVRKVTLEPAPLSPPHKRLAMLWWLLPEWTERTIDEGVIAGWRDAGVDPAFIDKLAPLSGKRFRSSLEFVEALRRATGDPKLERLQSELGDRKLSDARYGFGPILGTTATGSLGQFLVIIPRDRLVAVRMRRAPAGAADKADIEKGFPDFPDRVVGLVTNQAAVP